MLGELVPRRVAEAPGRIASLDQFRGYTVLAMLVVNLAGRYEATPTLLKHHNTYCSFADTIFPHFVFAVGFAYRLTMLRRASDPQAAWKALKRAGGLILVGVALYLAAPLAGSWSHFGRETFGPYWFRALTKDLFQALVHIGVACAWTLPVIRAGLSARLVFTAGSVALHLLLSRWFYYDWVTSWPGIDGGPLGFLTWTVPLVAGSICHDIYISRAPLDSAKSMALWGGALMAAGYAVSCIQQPAPPPFIAPQGAVDMWAMSQRAGSFSYHAFAAGLSMALYAAFVLACDSGGWQVGILRTLGTNALAAYVVHSILQLGFKAMIPRAAPGALVLAGLAGFLASCYLIIRRMEMHRLYWRM